MRVRKIPKNKKKKHSQEHKEKISQKMKEFWRNIDIETRQKCLEGSKKGGRKRAEQITKKERIEMGKKAEETKRKNRVYEDRHRKALKRREAKRTLCNCGCGELAPYPMKYIPGHNRRFAIPNLFIFEGSYLYIDVCLRSNSRKKGPRGTYLGRIIVDKEDYLKVRDYTWTINKDGYALTRLPREGFKYKADLLMHHLIVGNRWDEGLVVDHINRNKLDNRRENLRYVLPGENSQNCEKRPGLVRTRYGQVFNTGNGYVGLVEWMTPECRSPEEVLFKYGSEMERVKELVLGDLIAVSE